MKETSVWMLAWRRFKRDRVAVEDEGARLLNFIATDVGRRGEIVVEPRIARDPQRV